MTSQTNGGGEGVKGAAPTESDEEDADLQDKKPTVSITVGQGFTASLLSQQGEECNHSKNFKILFVDLYVFI
jgi:hypothetical protein